MLKQDNSFITFAGFPYCQDISKSQAKVAMVGIPFGTSYPGKPSPNSFSAPKVIRQESNRYPDDPIAWDFDLDGTLFNLCGNLVVDCGDLEGNQNDSLLNRTTAKDVIRQIVSAEAIPIVLGGDDSIPIPVMRAYEGQEPFYVLQLDAHIDWRDEVDGIKEGYSSTMRRVSEMPWVMGIVQVGARGVGSARQKEYRAAQEYGAKLITARQFHEVGIESVSKFIPEGSRCFVTMDFDVLDPSIMPSVGAPTPGGLYFQETIDLVFEVSRKARIVGVCLVEMVPEADLNCLGIITATRVAWNVVGAIAGGLNKYT